MPTSSTDETSQASSETAPEEVKQRGICFTIMPFGGWFDSYYQEIFKPAIHAAGLLPRRADDLYRPSTIVNDIWAYTKASTLVLADLTGKNPNVFYELGLAHALAKPVILVVEDMSDVPFDLRALRVIVYDKNESAWGEVLRTKLKTAIREVLEAPKAAVLPAFLEIDLNSERLTVSRVEKEYLELRKELDIIRRELSPSNSNSESFWHALDNFPFLAQIRELLVERVKEGVPHEDIIEELKARGVKEEWARAEIAEVRQIVSSESLRTRSQNGEGRNRVLRSVYVLAQEQEEVIRSLGNIEVIATSLHAKTGADLLRAAAAKLRFVDSKPHFSRGDLLKEMRGAGAFFRDSYASNLSSYLQRFTKNGLFAKHTRDLYRLTELEEARLKRSIGLQPNI